MKYHVTAAKEIKECKCAEGKCRSKHGSFSTKKEAQAAVRTLRKPVAKKAVAKKTAAKKTPSKKEPKPVAVLDPAAEQEPNSEIDTAEAVDKIEEPELNESSETVVSYGEGDQTLEESASTDVEPEEIDSEEETAAEDPQPTVANSGDYWDDDEDFLAGDDRVLDEKQDSAIFKQTEGVIRWDLDNFYSETGERRGKYSLRQDPPILRIEDSGDNQVEFVLTKEVAYSLYKVFDTVHRGYYGVGPRKEKGEKRDSKLLEVTTWLEENPVKSVLLAVFVLALLIFGFVV